MERDDSPRIDLASFSGNPNIGLYLFATDSYVLVPLSIHDSLLHKVEKVFNVPIIKTNIAGTSLLGVLLAGDSNKLLVPKIILDTEVKTLEDKGIDFSIVDTDLTALGNNIVSTEKALLVNPDYDTNSIIQLKKFTGKDIIKWESSDYKTIGSLIKVRGSRAIVSPLIEREKNLIKELLNLDKVFSTSVNFGSPFVSSGIVANKNGMLIGEKTTGLESMQIEQAFGFTKYE